jgi:hypothetical protein
MASITTARSGKAGSVAGTPGSGDVGAEITEWSLDDTVESLDATNMAGGGFFDSVEGIFKATGSFTAVGGTPPGKGTVTSVILATNDTPGSDTYEGDILITSKAVSVPVQGSVISYTCNFEFRGSYVEGVVV